MTDLRWRARLDRTAADPYALALATLAAVAGVAVYALAIGLFPHHSLNHDEGVYLQQAAMLLDGQIFLRPPVEGAFRPWFFVADGDRLYSKYAPVPAAMFALGRLAGGYRLALAAVAAGNVALVAGVVAEAFDRPTGVLAAAFVLASPLFLVDSAAFLPYAPTTLLNLAFAFAYLRADRTGSRRWAGLAGVAAGLAFFSRPYTAVLFAVPFVAHALWTLRTLARATVARHAATAATGLAGVALALGYNAVVTGSPFIFPYEAFAPLDGLGFGYRRLLGNDEMYTPELALRANARVLWLLFTDWVAGGLLGTLLAALGVAVAFRRGLDARRAALAGLFVSVAAGNVYFWGNRNLLGDLDRAGDGLVAFLGPYYHFDLLLPTAAFAAVGSLALARRVRGAIRARLGPRRARVAVALALLVGGTAFTAAALAAAADPVEDNATVTAEYERAYAPFEERSLDDALVLLPTPYGDWLNHPFQALRNDPGFDGPAVYALGERPFAVADAYPDRTLYRYVYRGFWNPTDGRPVDARLQRVSDVTGEAVVLSATLGVPDGVESLTFRVSTDEGAAYYVAENASGTLATRLSVVDGRVELRGSAVRVGNATLRVEGSDTVRMTAFADYGSGAGFSYRLELPVRAIDGQIRALSPHVSVCRDPRACGTPAAAYVPDAARAGVSIRTTLTANASHKFRSA